MKTISAILVCAALAATPSLGAATPAAPEISPLTGLPPVMLPDGSSPLTGRVLEISSPSDIVLRPGEVILTFDDGPKPSTTESILKTLNAYGVKATFFMIGRNALAHPETAQSVYLAGETIGSHTFDHADLSKLTPEQALDDVVRGDNAVRAALAPIGGTDTPLFRFPYLAQTPLVRASIRSDSYIPIGAQMDSDDYFTTSPARLYRRILKELDKKGSGIILMHDIHERTALMLPNLLDALIARHYTVVQLAFSGAPSVQLRTAGQD